jgi:hypothetical protein
VGHPERAGDVHNGQFIIAEAPQQAFGGLQN